VDDVLAVQLGQDLTERTGDLEERVEVRPTRLDQAPEWEEASVFKHQAGPAFTLHELIGARHTCHREPAQQFKLVLEGHSVGYGAGDLSGGFQQDWPLVLRASAPTDHVALVA
jgi:hypothetical protein